MKQITLVFYDRDFCGEWRYPLPDEARLAVFFADLNRELAGCDVFFDYCHEPNVTLRVRGYGDLLNSIRIRSPQQGFASLCLSQALGPSPGTDLLDDIRRALRRVAFSPESIAPEGGEQLCHNCGCGC